MVVGNGMMHLPNKHGMTLDRVIEELGASKSMVIVGEIVYSAHRAQLHIHNHLHHLSLLRYNVHGRGNV
jgi:hypothetical protein